MSEIPTGTYFPDDIARSFSSFQPGDMEQTDMEVAFNGREVRRSRFTSAYQTFAATTIPLDIDATKTLRNFMRGRRGRRKNFYIFPPNNEYYVSAECGTVSGTTILIPFANSTIEAVYVDATPITAFTMQSAVGPGGEDQITFESTQSGVVTCDLYARKRFLVRSDLDDWSRAVQMTPQFHTVWSLKFKELR